MKGLPLTYSKDMQEDKEAVFDAAETLDLMLAAMTGMVRDMTIDAGAMKTRRRRRLFDRDRPRRLAGARRSACRSARPTTSPAAPWRWPRARKVGLEKLALADLQAIHPGITEDVFSVLSVENSVKSRTSFGGTAPAEVRKQIALLEEAPRQGVICRGAKRRQTSLKAADAIVSRARMGSMTAGRILTTLVLAHGCGSACRPAAARPASTRPTRRRSRPARMPLNAGRAGYRRSRKNPTRTSRFLLDPLL